MTIRLTQTQFSSQLGGLGNTDTIDFSYSMPAVTLASSSSSTETIIIPVSRTDTLNRVQIKISLENEWRPVARGLLYYNNVSVPSATWVLQLIPKGSSNSIEFRAYRQNVSASSQNLPAFTIDFKIRVMRPPF